MPLKFRCPCGCKVTVPQHYAGRSLRCPQCKQRVTVPAESAAQDPNPAAPRQSSDQRTTPKPPPLARSAGAGAAAADRPAITTREAPAARPSHEPLSASQSELRASYLPDSGKLATVRWFAAGLVVTSLVGTIPAIWELFEYRPAELYGALPRWCYAIFFVALVQFAYTVCLIQLVDWSSTWVVTILTMLSATGYAVILGLALLAPDRGPLVEMFDLAGRLTDRRVAAWSFIMLCLTGLWSYAGGRFSIRWFNVAQHR